MPIRYTDSAGGAYDLFLGLRLRRWHPRTGNTYLPASIFQAFGILPGDKCQPHVDRFSEIKPSR